ncbi:MAG: hypothetical protein NVSMB31_04960 [Vulcanimicrobiaceae bacterium]
MLPYYECCSKCQTPRIVGYYENNVYSSIRSICTCMNGLGSRFTEPGLWDRTRRRDARNAFLEVRSAIYKTRGFEA